MSNRRYTYSMPAGGGSSKGGGSAGIGGAGTASVAAKIPLLTSSGLNQQQHNAIDQYWGGGENGSEYLNNILRTGHLRSRDDFRTVDNLDSAIAGSKLSSATTVYRGVAGSLTHKLKVGSVVRDKAFNSVSTTAAKIEPFRRGYEVGSKSGKLIEIKLPAGHRAVAVPSGLDELLLGRNSRYKVTHVTSDTVTMVPY